MLLLAAAASAPPRCCSAMVLCLKATLARSASPSTSSWSLSARHGAGEGEGVESPLKVADPAPEGAAAQSSAPCPHFVIEALGDTTPHEYFQFVNSRSGSREDQFEDEHQPTYRDISTLCKSIFLKGAK